VQWDHDPEAFAMIGAAEATSVVLIRPLTVYYVNGSSDTIPTGTVAVLADGVTTTFNRGQSVFIIYTVPGSGLLHAISESQVAGLMGDYALILTVLRHEIEPYQPMQPSGTALRAGAWSGGAFIRGGYQALILADLPTAYWPLTESGTTAGSVYVDVTGHGYNVHVLLGAITHGSGPLTGSTAPIMPARNWPGAPDSITTDALVGSTTAGLPQDGDPYTIELWVKPGASTIFMAPISWGPLNFAGPFLGIDFRNRTPLTPTQQVESFNPTNSFSKRFSTPFMFDGAWHYIVLTDNAAGNVKIYVDAVLVGSTTTAGTSNGYVPAAGDVISLGDAGSDGGTFPCPAEEDYSGGLAQIALYTSVLSASQVSAHYAAAI
jgi:Concanavalin A-like lectin/glucanases superfamily